MIVAQEQTPDRISITLSNGVTWEYTSADAAKHGDAETARRAIIADALSVLGEFVAPGALYVGLDASLKFTGLEIRNGVRPDNPPEVREIVVTRDSCTITAFDGSRKTLTSAETTEAAITEALRESYPDGQYSVTVTKTGRDLSTVRVGGTEGRR